MTMISDLALTNVKPEHIKQLMRWFNNEAELQQWSGPNFEYPYTLDSFQRDLKIDELASYVLMNDHQELLAFGQFYERLNRVHLGRLVVNPSHRGKRIINQLMHFLIEKAQVQLQRNEVSLFVLNNNPSAIKAYQSFGFVVEEYPAEMLLDDCLYMVKPMNKNTAT